MSGDDHPRPVYTMSGDDHPRPVYTLRPHSGEVTALRYVVIGCKGGLATGTSSGQLSVWDLESKRQLWLQTCSSAVLAIGALPSGKLLSQSRSGAVDTWNIETQVKDSSFEIEKAGFCKLSITTEATGTHPSGCFAVAGCGYGKVNLYDNYQHQLVSSLCCKDKGMCMSVKLIPCASNGVLYVLAGCEDGSVVAWDCRKSSMELAKLNLFSEPAMCVDYDSQNQRGVAGSPLKHLEVFRFDFSEMQKCYSVELRNAGVADVAVRQDSRIMVSGGWDGRIRVFGWKKGIPLAIMNYHSGTVNCTVFAGVTAADHDSNLLACGSKDERVSLWKLY